MKTGFSSLVCPGWDLETIVHRAADLGFEGIELRGLQGQLHLPAVPQLSDKPERVRNLLSERNVELVCLGSSITLDSRDRSEISRQKSVLREYLGLAAGLGCPFVRMFAGEVQRRDHRRAALSRIAEELIHIAPAAAQYGVTVLVENGGDFPDSEALWFLMDAVGQTSVKCCWNQCTARLVGEHATTSIPRLGRKIGMVHMCDAQFNDNGQITQFTPLGEGDVEVERQIELLRGVIYAGYLMFEWPKLWDPALADADAVLPEAVRYLKERLSAKQSILTAYKNDPKPAKFRLQPVADGKT